MPWLSGVLAQQLSPTFLAQNAPVPKLAQPSSVVQFATQAPAGPMLPQMRALSVNRVRQSHTKDPLQPDVPVQIFCPAWQVPAPWQTPPAQTCPVGQQTPPAQLRSGGQKQVPLMQTRLPLHVPHDPPQPSLPHALVVAQVGIQHWPFRHVPPMQGVPSGLFFLHLPCLRFLQGGHFFLATAS
jgi:hypothetical protein